MPETSMAVPTAVDALVRVSVDEIDEETALAAITAQRKHEIGIAIGGVAPIAIGLLLLVAPPGLVPMAAMVAIGLLSLTSPVVMFAAMRRAFLAECASLGIARPAAKRLFRRVIKAEFLIAKGSQKARDRALAASATSIKLR